MSKNASDGLSKPEEQFTDLFSQFGTVVNNKDLFQKLPLWSSISNHKMCENSEGGKKSHVQKNVEYPDVVNSVPGSLAGIRTHLWHQTLPPAQKHKGENKQLAPQTFMRIHSFWWANLRWRGAGAVCTWMLTSDGMLKRKFWTSGGNEIGILVQILSLTSNKS